MENTLLFSLSFVEGLHFFLERDDLRQHPNRRSCRAKSRHARAALGPSTSLDTNGCRIWV